MRRGFTLVELVVVLIVIGLIAGGIVVGRDLLHSARLRAQVTQPEQFDAALGAFRSKYAGIPGDLRANHAMELGFVARSGAPGHGDGNGLLDACEPWDPFSGNVPLGCEIVLFWSDLADSGLLAGTFPAAEDDYINVAAVEDSFGYFPRAVIAESWNAVVVPVRCLTTGHNYKLLRINSAAAPSFTMGRALYARDAWWIDNKIDDGKPRTGRMQERGMGYGGDGFFCLTSLPVSCVSGDDYNLVATAVPGACSPQLQMAGM